jgi:hypothetical protein
VLKDFTRTIWKKGHEEWSRTLTKITCLYQEAEIKMVAEGKRRAATMHLNQNDTDLQLLKLNDLGLIFTPLYRSGFFQGFSHQIKAPAPGEPFFWFGCVTKTLEDGKKFKKADESVDYITTGELLGYPDCCIKYFNKVFPINTDPVWTTLEGAISGYPECNTLARYFGPRITAHISCSPICEATKRVGQDWLAVMDSIDHDTTIELKQFLEAQMVWDSYHGILELHTEHFLGLTHTHVYLDKHRIINWSGTP